MTILALDLGTATGWATDLGGRIESGTQTFDLKRGESPGMRFIRFNRWLDDFWCRGVSSSSPGLRVSIQPEFLVYEAAHQRGGAATEIAAGFTTRVQEFCARHAIEHASVHSATLKKWTTGKGNADKDAMRAAAVVRGWNRVTVRALIEDDNEIDALCLLHYARAEIVGSGR